MTHSMVHSTLVTGTKVAVNHQLSLKMYGIVLLLCGTGGVNFRVTNISKSEEYFYTIKYLLRNAKIPCKIKVLHGTIYASYFALFLRLCIYIYIYIYIYSNGMDSKECTKRE